MGMLFEFIRMPKYKVTILVDDGNDTAMRNLDKHMPDGFADGCLMTTRLMRPGVTAEGFMAHVLSKNNGYTWDEVEPRVWALMPPQRSES